MIFPNKEYNNQYRATANEDSQDTKMKSSRSKYSQNLSTASKKSLPNWIRTESMATKPVMLGVDICNTKQMSPSLAAQSTLKNKSNTAMSDKTNIINVVDAAESYARHQSTDIGSYMYQDYIEHENEFYDYNDICYNPDVSDILTNAVSKKKKKNRVLGAESVHKSPKASQTSLGMSSTTQNKTPDSCHEGEDISVENSNFPKFNQQQQQQRHQSKTTYMSNHSVDYSAKSSASSFANSTTGLLYENITSPESQFYCNTTYKLDEQQKVLSSPEDSLSLNQVCPNNSIRDMKSYPTRSYRHDTTDFHEPRFQQYNNLIPYMQNSSESMAKKKPENFEYYVAESNTELKSPNKLYSTRTNVATSTFKPKEVSKTKTKNSLKKIDTIKKKEPVQVQGSVHDESATKALAAIRAVTAANEAFNFNGQDTAIYTVEDLRGIPQQNRMPPSWVLSKDPVHKGISSQHDHKPHDSFNLSSSNPTVKHRSQVVVHPISRGKYNIANETQKQKIPQKKYDSMDRITSGSADYPFVQPQCMPHVDRAVSIKSSNSDLAVGEKVSTRSDFPTVMTCKSVSSANACEHVNDYTKLNDISFANEYVYQTESGYFSVGNKPLLAQENDPFLRTTQFRWLTGQPQTKTCRVYNIPETSKGETLRNFHGHTNWNAREVIIQSDNDPLKARKLSSSNTSSPEATSNRVFQAIPAVQICNEGLTDKKKSAAPRPKAKGLYFSKKPVQSNFDRFKKKTNTHSKKMAGLTLIDFKKFDPISMVDKSWTAQDQLGFLKCDKLTPPRTRGRVDQLPNTENVYTDQTQLISPVKCEDPAPIRQAFKSPTPQRKRQNMKLPIPQEESLLNNLGSFAFGYAETPATLNPMSSRYENSSKSRRERIITRAQEYYRTQDSLYKTDIEQEHILNETVASEANDINTDPKYRKAASMSRIKLSSKNNTQSEFDNETQPNEKIKYKSGSPCSYSQFEAKISEYLNAYSRLVISDTNALSTFIQECADIGYDSHKSINEQVSRSGYRMMVSDFIVTHLMKDSIRKSINQYSKYFSQYCDENFDTMHKI